MELLTIDDFKPFEGQAFKIKIAEENWLDLVLTSVTGSKVFNYPGKARDPFSLFFDGTKDNCCRQGIYHLRHESGWTTDIFLVPIAANPDGTFRYQALFN